VAVVEPEAELARAGGQVATVEGSEFVLTTLRGEEVTVHTDGGTAFRIPGVEEPGLDDVEAGALVGVVGIRSEDGSLQAILVVPRAAQRHARLTGEVAEIEGTTVHIRLAGGRTVALLTDEETDVRVPGVEEASLADVEVGDRVAVQAELQEGTPHARLLVVLPDHPARLEGRVLSITDGTLEVDTLHGPVVVLTDGSTLFRVPGVEEATLADVRVGDRVVCGGAWEGPETFRASAVVVRPGQVGPDRPAAVGGRAIAVGEDRLVVGTAHGPVTVVVGEETEIRVPGVDSPSLADIHPGDRVMARGRWDEEGNLRAEAIGVVGR